MDSTGNPWAEGSSMPGLDKDLHTGTGVVAGMVLLVPVQLD